MIFRVDFRNRQLGPEAIVLTPAVLMKNNTDPRDTLAAQDDLVVSKQTYHAAAIWRTKQWLESIVRLFIVWIGWIEVGDLPV